MSEGTFMKAFASTWKVIVLASLLWGCSKPKVEMASFNSSLAQMKSVGTGPFDQDISVNKYVVFQGQCISIVTDFQIKIDSGNWHFIPYHAPTAGSGETAPSSLTYDVSCSDGTYTFWVFESQFMSWLTLDGRATNESVDTISLRGLAGSFATEPTVYVNTNHSNNTPANIGIYKTWAPAGALSGQCVEVAVRLTSVNGDSASSSSATYFSISGPNIGSGLFQNFADCNVSSNSIDAANLLIDPNKHESRYYYKVPSGSPGSTVSLALNYSGSLTASPSLASFAIKQSTDRYLEFWSPYRVLTGMCYPVKIKIREYSGSSISGSGPVTITTSPEMKFYIASDCSSANINSTSVSGSEAVIYMKIDENISPSNGTVTLSASGYDNGVGKVFYDDSGDDSVSYVRIHGPTYLSSSSASAFEIEQYNSKGASIIGSNPTSISLSATSGFFCPFPGSCFSPLGFTSTQIPAGSHKVSIQYHPNSATGPQTITIIGTSPATTSFNYIVNPL